MKKDSEEYFIKVMKMFGMKISRIVSDFQFLV